MDKPIKAVNKYDGEIKLKLYGIEYPMRWNARVYAQFKSETGVDPHALFMDMLNEVNIIKSLGTFDKGTDVANTELMARLSGIAQMHLAAWLFYLSAKELDKAVTFEEIQEAVLLEGVSSTSYTPDGELVTTYPYLVFEFAIFVLGIGNSEPEEDDIKKNKQNSRPLFIQRLASLLSI